MSVLWVSTFTVGFEIVPQAQLSDFSYMTSDIVTHSDFSPQYTGLGVLHPFPTETFPSLLEIVAAAKMECFLLCLWVVGAGNGAWLAFLKWRGKDAELTSSDLAGECFPSKQEGQ